MNKLVFAGLVAVSAAIAGAADFTIAERGKKPETMIVVPADARPVVVSTVKDFIAHVKRMTDVKLKSGTEAKPGMRVIRLESAAPEAVYDGFSYEVSDGEILIKGADDRGVAYALYELLERFGGCGWYSKSFDVVPTVDRFSVPVGAKDSQTAVFESRETFWYDLCHDGRLGVKLRSNARSWVINPPQNGGSPHRFGKKLGSCHTLGHLLPPGKYFNEHPEYFAERNGKRTSNQPCLSNPDVLRIVTENVLKGIAEDPDAKYYGVSQNDNHDYCQCEKCRAIDAEEGSPSGTIIRFVNAVAESVEKRYPDKIIETLAYSYSQKPPKIVRPRDNVLICLCSIKCDFSHPLATGSHEENVRFREDIVRWGELAKKLYVWDYVTAFNHYLTIYPNEAVLQDNVRFFRDHNVKMLFEQGDMTGRHADMAELKQWLLTKLLWNPEADVAALTGRFLRDYYGAGAPFIAEYLELRRAAAVKSAYLGIKEDAASDRFTMDELDRFAELWRKAEKAVKDDPERLYNVRFGSLAVDYCRICRLIAGGCKLFGVSETKSDFGRLAALCTRFVEIAKTVKDGPFALSENKNDSARVLKLIEKMSARKDDELPAEGDETCVKLVANAWGKYVDDQLASNGRALRLNAGIAVWSAQLPLRDVAFVPGRRHVMSVRVRVNPRDGVAPDHEVFSFGAHNPKPQGKEPKVRRSVKASEVSGGEYRWFDLPAFVPTELHNFWVMPGPRDDIGVTSDGVFIDAVRLRLDE